MAIPPINHQLVVSVQDDAVFHFSDLPLDIQKFIFSFFTLEDLVRSSQISHSWKILSDSDERWATFLKRMGLSFRPNQLTPARVEYGQIQTAFRKEKRYGFKNFPSWFRQAVRHEENLFFESREEIQVFNFRTQSQNVLSTRPQSLVTHRTKIEIVSDYLVEIVFLDSSLLCNLYSARSCLPLFSWSQSIHPERFLKNQISAQSLILLLSNKLFHAVDAAEDGKPAICVRSVEKECPIEKTFSHPAPVVFFQIYENQIFSIDAESKLRVWDILSGNCSKTVSLKLPVKFEMQDSNPSIVNEKGIFVEGYLSNLTEITYHLDRIMIGNDGEIFLSFRSLHLKSLAKNSIGVFSKEGKFKEFFTGEIAFIDNKNDFRIIREEMNECSMGTLSRLEGKSLAHYGRLWIFAPPSDLSTPPFDLSVSSIYDLKDGTLLEEGIFECFNVADRVIYLKTDGVIYERDIHSAEVTRCYIRDASKKVDSRTILLQELPSVNSFSGFESERSENGITIQVKEYEVTISFVASQREKLVLEVKNPQEDIQTFANNVGVLAKDGTLYLINEAEIITHERLVSKIAAYGHQLIVKAGIFMHIVEDLHTIHECLQLDVCHLFAFDKGRFIGVNPEKIEIWDLPAQTYSSMERRFDFLLLEIVVKNDLLYEVVQDLTGSKGMLIWDLITRRQIATLPHLFEYKILDTLIVTWDTYAEMSLWTLKGRHLRDVSEPYQSPKEQYFYFFGKDYISYSGSGGGSLETLTPGQCFYLDYPVLQPESLPIQPLIEQKDIDPEKNPKRRKLHETDSF